MGDDGNACLVTRLVEVHRGVGAEVVDHSAIIGIGKGERAAGVGVALAPSLATDAASGEIVHSFLDSLITEVVVAAEGIVFVGGYPSEVIHKLLHLVDVAPKLVAQSHHSEGRVMTILMQDVYTLLMQEGHELLVLPVEGAPEGQFGLEVDAERIGGGEGRLGRAPGVEADVVDAVFPAGAEIFHPSLHRHIHMPGQRPYGCIVLAAEEYLMAVGEEMPTLNVEV